MGANDILEIDGEQSVREANYVLALFEGIPLQNTKTALCAVTISLVTMVSKAKKKYIIPNTTDGLEKMVLRWMAGLDEATDTHFAPYITIDE
jgi:hypothetical protein